MADKPATVVTDEMVESALVAGHNALALMLPEVGRWPDDYDEQEQFIERAIMRAVILDVLRSTSA
jgi:hypothetical protein